MSNTAKVTYDQLFKIIMIGNSGAGKTHIADRFVNDKFEKEYKPTIGVDFYSKIIQIDGKAVKLQLWDSAGQERFRTITGAYYRGAIGIITVVGFQNFDSQNKIVDETIEAFKARAKSEIDTWFSETKKYASDLASRFLVLNHADKFAEKIPDASARATIQQELLEHAQQKAKELEINFYNGQLFLVSAKTDQGVNELFTNTSRVILEKVQANPSLYPQNVFVAKDTAKQTSAGKHQTSTKDSFFKKNKYHLLALLLLMAITAAVVLAVLFPPIGLAAMIPTVAATLGLSGVSTAVLAVIAGAATLAVGAMIYGLANLAFGKDTVKGKSVAKSAKSADDQELLLPKGAPAGAGPTAYPAAAVVGSPASYQPVLRTSAPVTNSSDAQPPVSGQAPTLAKGSE